MARRGRVGLRLAVATFKRGRYDPCVMFPAISLPSIQEWIFIAIVAVLVFGRRLPEVIAQVLSAVRTARRHVDDLRRSTGFDQDLREAQRALDDVRATARREARVLTAPAPRIQSATESVRRGVRDLEDEIRRATPPTDGVASTATATLPEGGAEPQLDPNAPAIDPAPTRGPDPEPH